MTDKIAVQADLIVNEIQSIEQETNSIVQKADNYEIDSPEQYSSIAEFLKEIKRIMKRVCDSFDPIVKKMNAAHEEALAQKSKHMKPLEQAEGICKQKMNIWNAAAEKKRIEEEKRLLAQRQKEEEEARLDEAIALDHSGLKDEAEALLSEPITVAPPVVPSAPKIDGVSYREVWKYEIVDINKIPREFFVIDEKRIGQFVRAMKQNAKIPGVRIYCEKECAIKA